MLKLFPPRHQLDKTVEAIVIECDNTSAVAFEPDHPAWLELLTVERRSECLVSDEHFNLSHPKSFIIHCNVLPRPVFHNDWLENPFPSVVLPLSRLRIGDTVLVSFAFPCHVSVQGTIKAWLGPFSVLTQTGRR
uniref:Uncharacterized protein n=1 Tax=Spongospora subterranea TaxID=70186 RepID=A0A0H5RG87_9EUKA|eukprot:CRZ12736.1 hypothetical protein [Spongospora subterranea]